MNRSLALWLACQETIDDHGKAKLLRNTLCEGQGRRAIGELLKPFWIGHTGSGISNRFVLCD